DAAALLDHCGGLLARYKTPRSIRFVESLPRTALGKLRRRAAARLLESLFIRIRSGRGPGSLP
ncbi:MAG: hypothetical protein Q8R92_20670, partial [Deltaproteobacteria bacterium]|nr:hypothetical protein [Deltaproteobacteria bacterium]